MDEPTPKPTQAVPESREVATHRERVEAPSSEPTSGTLIIAVVAIVLLAVVGWAVLDGLGVSEPTVTTDEPVPAEPEFEPDTAADPVRPPADVVEEPAP